MKNVLSLFLERHAYSLLLLLLFVWVGVGIFPLTCYESDSMHLIAGCSLMYNQGLTVPPEYSYFYDMQPLVTYVVVLLKHVFTFLTCEQIYCLFTGIMAYVMILGCLRLVIRLTGENRILILLTLFFFPEAYACGMYPNTSVAAMALFVWALCFFADKRYAWGLVFLCVAPLFRIDVVIVYPAIFFLFMLSGMSAKKSLVVSLMSAVAVVVFLFVSCVLLKADPISHTLRTYSDFNAGLQYAGQVKYAVYTFYTVVNFILVPIGAFLLLRDKKALMLLFCLLPMVLLHFMFRNTGCATKHWLYLLPFAMILSLRGWRFIMDFSFRVRAFGVTILSLVLIFLFVGIRFDIPPSLLAVSKSYVASSVQDGPFFRILSEDKTPLKIRTGIGAGRVIPTADECMLVSGGAFYPFYINAYKSHKDRMRREALAVADSLKDYDMVAMEWGGRMYFQNLLLDRGYTFVQTKGKEGRYIFTTGSDTINSYLAEGFSKDETDRLIQTLDSLESVSGKPLLIVPETDSRACMLDILAKYGRISKKSERCYVLER